MRANIKKIKKILHSERLFWAIVAFFILEGLWIAFSTVYPMAFDEGDHFGLIQVYSHRLLPFLANQPPGSDVYGAVARDPSYMYHYLLSFPYRIFAHFFSGGYAQIIFLRSINVVIFAAGLIAFRRVLLFSGKISPAIVNVSSIFFVLTPTIPVLAAQINYDSLFFLTVAVTILLTLQLEHRTLSSKRIDLVLLAKLLAVCLVGSLVKYAFLPIFAAILIYVALTLLKNTSGAMGLKRATIEGFRLLTPTQKSLVFVLISFSFLLFFERYGLNLIHYHTPIPECNQVLDVQRCSAYGPWYRNYQLASAPHVTGSRFTQIEIFIGAWVGQMLYTLMYTIAVPGQGVDPYRVIKIIFTFMLAISAVILIRYGDKLHRTDRSMRLFIMVTTAYIITLLLQNYEDFNHIGKLEGVQGRYLLPVLLPFYAGIALIINALLRAHVFIKFVILIPILFCMFLRGGLAAYILRSNDSWYWPQRPIIGINRDIKEYL